MMHYIFDIISVALTQHQVNQHMQYSSFLALKCIIHLKRTYLIKVKIINTQRKKKADKEEFTVKSQV